MATYLFVTLAVTLIMGFPIWAAMATSSFVAITLGSNMPVIVIVQRLFTATDSFPLLAIPLFMVAGNLMSAGGMSRRIIEFCKALIGHVDGGLSMVAVLATMMFASVSGSGPATVAAIGGLMIPAMIAAGYDKGYSAALMSIAGAIGIIFPPSIAKVNFGVTGNVSITALFAAGIGPGIVMGIALMFVCYITAKKHGYGKNGAEEFSIANVWRTFKQAFFALIMPIIILGGIYGGIFTPTEAAAVSVAYGFFVGVFVYRELSMKDIPQVLMAAGRSTAMVMMLVAAASGFGWIMTAERIPDAIARFILSLSDNPLVILLIINIFLLIIGCFMEVLASIIILTPILLPIGVQLGVHPVHFGIIMIVNLAISLSTPPLGVNLFVACGISKCSIEQVVKKMGFLLLASIVSLLLTTYFEPIAMTIPRLLGLV